jgi:hypothetical protein
MSEDCMSLKNSQFCDYLHPLCPNELEVKDTTDKRKWSPGYT